MRTIFLPLILLCIAARALAAAAPATPLPDLNQAVVYTMAEPTDTDRKLDQALQAGSEVLVRGWFKWHNAFRIGPLGPLTAAAHARGALFGGGITCSALYDGENGLTRAQVEALATRGPAGQILDAWGQRGIRHGSLSNPAYLDYLFRWCREQIDAGVDYLFMDEANAALGAQEGYDAASLADFRRYLMTECPQTRGWSAADPRWKSQWKIDGADRALCPDGTMASFDYRGWLRARKLLENPNQAGNTLLPLWRQFRLWRDDRAWRALVGRIRAYAAEHGRRVMISGNGLAKYVDLQVLGVWGQWSTKDNHIDLGENRIPTWHATVQRGRAMAGRRVPVVLFHDWGFGTPPFPWLAVPPGEREVWMRTGGAEIYAAGAFFAFPVLGPMGCDAGRDGTLPAIARQTAFYRAQRDLYLKADYLGSEALKSATANLSLAVWARPDRRTLILHAVNRSVVAGELKPRQGVTVSLPLGRVPVRASVISPDFAGERPAACRLADGRLELALGDLAAYDVAVLSFDREVAVDALRDPSRTMTNNRWQAAQRSEFRVLEGGAIEDADDLNGMLQGKLHQELRNPPTFLVNAASAGKFSLHVRNVATLGARLEWRVDGQSVQTVDLPDLDHQNGDNAHEYDKVYSFPIPAGRHKLTLDNVGGDWANINWVALEGGFACY